MRPSPYAGPRPPAPPFALPPPRNGGGCASAVHRALPVTAFTAKSLFPELKYITPSITNGVSWAIISVAWTWNDQAWMSFLTFEALIWSSGQNLRFFTSRLWIGQSASLVPSVATDTRDHVTSGTSKSIILLRRITAPLKPVLFA